MVSPRFMAVLFVAAGMFLPLWGGVVEAAEKVNMRAWDHTSYGRIIFEWPTKAGYEITLKDNLLTVHFDKAMTGDLAPLLDRLSTYVSSAVIEADGHDVVFVLKRPHVYRSFANENAVIVDISPKAETKSVMPEDTEKPPPAKVEEVAASEPETQADPTAASCEKGALQGGAKIARADRQAPRVHPFRLRLVGQG